MQLSPALSGSAEKPLRVWKHNYMGITSFYDLNYGQFNPKNKNLDSFNHQVTAGWVAISDGKRGLLVGKDAQSLTSMAFCPMRVREINNNQTIALNPFGSYFGKQFSYSHLGGNGNGTAIMQAFSGALQPNGPSFNGENLRFSLLLAPYFGDEPPQELQDFAAAHFYPPGVIVHSAPTEMNAVTINDIKSFIAKEHNQAALQAVTPISPPTAFLANPSSNAVDLVWDAPREGLVTGYEIQWSNVPEKEWQSVFIEPLTRWHLDKLTDGKPLQFRIRSLRGKSCSAWTAEQYCTPGRVTGSSVISMLNRIPRWAMIKIIFASLWSLLRAKFYR